MTPDTLLPALALSALALMLAQEWRGHPAVHSTLIGLALFLNARYLVWRGLDSLNRAGAFPFMVSVLLYAAEVYGFVSILLFYLQAYWPRRRLPVPFPDVQAPTVDVLITIYDEPEDILRRTLAAATFMDYPAGRMRVHVLDDKNRPEIRALAERYRAGYIARESHLHAKAGNINHALPLTRGELIAIFDCDHVPVRSFLRETVGFFADPEVAIVQTPHNFYNPDTFERNLFLEHKLRNEQELFYSILMPGRDRFNSVFFAGTSGLIRRCALEQAGGFHVSSVIEDLYTSMELHARGWRSVYCDKVLSGALSAESFDAYLRQHQRWARGGVQVFVADNPLLKGGLTLMQRLHYFGSLLYFFHGLPRIVFLLSPLPFLFFGISAVAAPTSTLLSYFVPYYLATQAAFGLITRRFRNPFWSDVYETADGFGMARTVIATLLQPGRILFQVTPKGAAGQAETRGWGHIGPQTVALALLVAGMLLTLWRLASGSTWSGPAFLNLAWAVYNAILLTTAIAAGRERPYGRRAYRLHRHLRCVISGGGLASTGWTDNISEGGAEVLVRRDEPLPDELSIDLRCSCGQTLRTRGTVAWQRAQGNRRQRAGLRFEAFDEETLQQANRLIFSCPRSWDRRHHPPLSFGKSLGYMASALAVVLGQPGPESGRERRAATLASGKAA